MEISLIQTGLIFLVLIVGLFHLYLDQFTDPKSDIQIYSNPSQLDYGPLEDESVEIHFELTANNRGDDNGYVDTGKIIRFEFSETEEFSDPYQVDANSITTPSGFNSPYLTKVTVHQDNSPTEVLVPKGEVVTFKGVSDIYSDDLKHIYSEYRSMRAVIRFQCRDNTREYEREVTTRRVDLWWSRDPDE